MRTLVVCALLALVAFPTTTATPTVTVTLQVNAAHASLPVWRDCDVVVPAGSDVGDVLDQAVVDGCILEWSSSEFPGYGRYVTSIDHVQEAVATYWAFRIDGAYASTGIDDTPATSGETYLFTYEEWAVALPL